jgi:hypothetical protein
MHIDLNGPRRLIWACGAIVALHLAATAAADSLAGTWAAPVAATLGVGEARAQTTWGVSRRTARRTARRTTRRVDYRYATAVAATAYAPDGCYVADGRRLCPRMVGGEVVYVAS